MSLERDNIVGRRVRADGPGPEVMGASTLSGDAVVDRNGESLGEIKEIMVDVPTGRVAYAVLSFGGFLGIADKLFAVPWSALTLDSENRQFILDVDRDRLKDAPGFDKDHWPSMAQPTWASTVYKFYGVDPYWH
jgi:sporulation protein YlmC with PRC-barrel domain